MPAGSTTPPTTISFAAMMLAVSRHAMKTAVQPTKRQLRESDERGSGDDTPGTIPKNTRRF